MEQAGANIMCFGHTRKPYHRIIPTELSDTKHHRHAINKSSVGKPKDNNPKSCYVILTINQNSNIANKESVQVEFIRFDYNIEKAAKVIESSQLPNKYADMLRKGYQILNKTPSVSTLISYRTRIISPPMQAIF